MRVVVLDNDPAMRELMVRALGLLQVEARGVGTVEEAEPLLAEAHGLLMDFHLGAGHNGAWVARRWHAEGKLPRFWLVTGTPEDPEAQALRDLGELQRVVGKPFGLLPFVGEVAQTLASAPVVEQPQVPVENDVTEDVAPEAGAVEGSAPLVFPDPALGPSDLDPMESEDPDPMEPIPLE